MSLKAAINTPTSLCRPYSFCEIWSRVGLSLFPGTKSAAGAPVLQHVEAGLQIGLQAEVLLIPLPPPSSEQLHDHPGERLRDRRPDQVRRDGRLRDVMVHELQRIRGLEGGAAS